MRVDAVAGRDQRRDPGAAVGLDADHDLAGPGGVLCDQFVQSGDRARDALGQPPGGEALAGFVHELDVVVVLGPVVAHIQEADILLAAVLLCFEPLDQLDPAGDPSPSDGLMEQCSLARHPMSAAELPRYTSRRSVFL